MQVRGLGESCKLLQWVQAEPCRHIDFGAFSAENLAIRHSPFAVVFIKQEVGYGFNFQAEFGSACMAYRSTLSHFQQ